MYSVSRFGFCLVSCLAVALCAQVAWGQSVIVNEYAEVTALPSPCDAQAQFSVIYRDGTYTSARWAQGRKVLIIQMQGAAIATAETQDYGAVNSINGAGRYELALIETSTFNAGTGTGTVRIQGKIKNSYDLGGKVQIITLDPNPTGLVVTGTVTGLPWNGSTGGVVALDAEGQTLEVNGTITASGLGFRGADVNPYVDPPLNFTVLNTEYVIELPEVVPDDRLRAGRKGEGIYTGAKLYTDLLARGRLANGGGGGNASNAGGAGGSNYGKGGDGGTNQRSNNYPFGLGNGGVGGQALSSFYPENRLFLGGGGGSGHIKTLFYHQGRAIKDPGQGTDGGGIVFITAGSLTGSGSIVANGIDVPDFTIGQGNGGGGAGGTVFLNTPLAPAATLTIEANGGRGGYIWAEYNNDITPIIRRIYGAGGGGGGGAVLTTGAVPATVNVSVKGGASGLNFTNNPFFTSPQYPITLAVSEGLTYCSEFPYGYTAGDPLSVLANGAFAGQNGAVLPVFQNPDPNPVVFQATATVTDEKCAGNKDGTITIIPKNGTPPYKYLISPNPNGAGQNSNFFSGLPPGSYDFDVIDNNGCSTKVDDVVIRQAQDFTISFIPPDRICFNSFTGEIVVNKDGLGGVEPLTYRLLTDAGATVYRDEQRSNTFSSLPAGTYIAEATDANGCLRQFGPVTISQFAEPITAGPELTFCLGSPTEFPVDDNGNRTPVQDLAQRLQESPPASSTSRFYLEGRRNDTVGSYLGFIPTGSFSVFDFQNFYDRQPNAVPGRYKVFYEVSRGCRDSTYINFVYLEPYQDETLCVNVGDFVPRVPTVPGGTWTGQGVKNLTNGTVDLAAVLANGQPTTTPQDSLRVTTLTYTSPQGCTTSFRVFVRKAPKADFTTNPVIAANFGTVLNVPKETIALTNRSSDDAVSYSWDFGNGLTSTEKNPGPVRYEIDALRDTVDISLTVTDANGCQNTKTVKGLVLERFPTLEVYNVITVSGNPKNKFEVNGSNLRDLSVHIYDRWGREVFAHTGAKDLVVWDGTIDGSSPIEGVYFYQIKARRFDDKILERSGSVTVLR
jgi:hypothetical protein